MSIMLIPFTIPEDRYDENGKIVERKGDVVVSHGVDEISGKTVILPCEPFQSFVSEHCECAFGEYFLKEDAA